MADNVYFGDSKRDGDGGNFAPPPANNYGSYPTAPAAPAYSAPAASAPASDFAMLDDDDAQLPF